jgi:hypothetical protein
VQRRDRAVPHEPVSDGLGAYVSPKSREVVVEVLGCVRKQAFMFTERPQLGPDMYVIVRVMRLGTPEPTHKVYADPHRALYLGRLQCVSPVSLQRNPQYLDSD